MLDGGGTIVTAAQPGAHPGGNLDITVSGDANKLMPDAMIAMFYALASPYRQNSTWLMSSAAAAAIRTIKDTAGRYMWQESYILGQPPTLIGRPVTIDENMPAVAAGNYPVAFGDFQAGYVINDRIGTRVLRDPYTSKPYVLFYVTRRVGAGVQDPRAIRLLKIAAS